MVIQQKRIRSISRHFSHVNPGEEIILGIPINAENISILENMGFSSELIHGETLLPPPNFGTISVYNSEGKFNVRRDLPMETAYRQAEWTWIEWHGQYEVEQSDIVDVPYQRYPREFVPPPSIELSISVSNGNVVLISPSYQFSPDFYEDVIHVVNLFLEIFGECHILNESLESFVIPTVIRLNWDILPEGEYPWEVLEEYIEPIIRSATIGKRPVIEHRLETISGYNPNFVAKGKSGFYGYLVFGFPEKNLYICESAFYGNATYVFEEDWETLSRLTKAEILNNSLHSDRIIHRENWPRLIDQLLD